MTRPVTSRFPNHLAGFARLRELGGRPDARRITKLSAAERQNRATAAERQNRATPKRQKHDNAAEPHRHDSSATAVIQNLPTLYGDT
jgi:hypothetical protein